MRFNRFVFLNLPMLSLETHLGVTASPQAPFPADYVTLPVSGKSPPLRLTPSRSRGRACSLLQHQLRRDMHSRHAQATRPPFGRASLSGRTVRLVDAPGTTDRTGKSIPTLLKFRNIPEHPSHDRRVRNDHAALGHYRNEISVAQAIGDVPAHAQNND